MNHYPLKHKCLFCNLPMVYNQYQKTNYSRVIHLSCAKIIRIGFRFNHDNWISKEEKELLTDRLMNYYRAKRKI